MNDKTNNIKNRKYFDDSICSKQRNAMVILCQRKFKTGRMLSPIENKLPDVDYLPSIAI